MNFTKGDSLLSNISNISGRIDLKPSDGSGFFINFQQDAQKQPQQQQMIQIVNQDQNNHSSLLDKINIQNKDTMVPSLQGCVDGKWYINKQNMGMSEEEDDSESNDNPRNGQSFSMQKSQTGEKRSDVQSKQVYQNSEQQRKKQILLQRRLKNQTKNIPKNYGKAIITFIQKYQQKVKQITKRQGIDYNDFIQQLKQRKKTINTIADLRNLWVDYKYSRCMRLLSNLFLRKYSLNYIFNSRICNYGSHIKYRYRLCQAIKEPNTFKHIKDY